MKEVVASGLTVEEAKTEAMRELGVDSEEYVEVEVIDQGSKGVFGWGTKFARVKVRLVKEPPEKALKVEKIEKLEKPEKALKVEKVEKLEKVEKAAKKETKKESIAPVERVQEKPQKEEVASRRRPVVKERAQMPLITVGEIPLPFNHVDLPGADMDEDEDYVDAGDEDIFEDYKEEDDSIDLLEEDEGGEFNPRNILKNVLDLMGLDAEIKLIKSSGGPVYSVIGGDLGSLIGKHGQTLESLQFLVNLIMLRRTKRRRKVTIDIEGYRSRREKSLQDLARRLADKAKKEKRNVVLEPMLPSERRIIHMTLQGNPGVSTYSQGEEPMRKVIISPKKRSNYRHSHDKKPQGVKN